MVRAANKPRARLFAMRGARVERAPDEGKSTMQRTHIRPRSAHRAVLGLALLGLAAGPTAAWAFGGEAPSQTHECPKGKVWNGKKCVAASKVKDRTLVEQGRQLAVTGHYTQAIDVLNAVKSKRNALALTYLGYSYRKSGQFDRGMALYQQALAIAPNSTVTREYLGEGYAEAGRVDLARLELAKVEKLCGNTGCEEYRDLAEAIEQAAAR